MKKTTILITLTVTVFSIFNSFSQTNESIPRKNVVNVNLSSMLLSHFGVSYERAISNKNSVRLYGDIAYLNYTGNDSDIKMNGFGIIPEFRHYVSKKGALRGYFIGVYAPIRRYELEGSFIDDNKKFDGEGTFSYLGFGFVNGPQWLFGNRISLAIPFGLSLGAGTVKGNYVYVDPDPTKSETRKADIPLVGGSFMPRLGIELGVAF